MRSMQKVPKIRRGWKKPPEGILMVNIDAAFDDGCGSSGVVIRDSGGGFIAAANNYFPLVLDAQMAETYALREGLRLAQQLGCSTVIVQSDCLEVVQTIQDGDFSAMASAPISDECYNL